MTIPTREEREKNAKEIGASLYTAEKWSKIIAGIAKLSPEFADFVKQIPYGSIYPREKLGLREREIIAITTLTQLGLKPQLKSHIIAALNQGMTKEELLEIFLHISMFVGFPTVLESLKVAHEVFEHYNL